MQTRHQEPLYLFLGNTIRLVQNHSWLSCGIHLIDVNGWKDIGNGTEAGFLRGMHDQMDEVYV